jgi:hypothetical protein
MVEKFLNERTASVSWFNSPIERSSIHPKLGTVSTRLSLTSWLSHDLLHIRQIINLHYLYLSAPIIRVCFIWPSSVPGGKMKRQSVLLGFVTGKLMRAEIRYLEGENRKQVRTKTFFDPKEIDIDLVKYIFLRRWRWKGKEIKIFTVKV